MQVQILFKEDKNKTKETNKHKLVETLVHVSINNNQIAAINTQSSSAWMFCFQCSSKKKIIKKNDN